MFRPYDGHRDIAEETKKLKSTAASKKRERAYHYLHDMKKREEEIEQAPLHLLEVSSFLLSITIMWFAVFFLNNPPASDGECVGVTDKVQCVGEQGSSSGGGGYGGGQREGMSDARRSGTPSCSWDDAGGVCYVQGGAFNDFLVVVLILSNIGFLLVCVYYFAKGFVKRNQGVKKNLGRLNAKFRTIRQRLSISEVELPAIETEQGASPWARAGLSLRDDAGETGLFVFSSEARREAGFKVVENPLSHCVVQETSVCA